MKNKIKLTALALLSFAISSCSDNKGTNTTTTITSYAKDGLDLKLVTELAKTTKDAETFEKSLNTQGNKYNNLDLNEDKKVDFVNVTEYGDDTKKGYSLSTKSTGEIQEIATILFEKEGEGARVTTRGNEQMYGSNNSFGSSIQSAATWGMVGYLWGSHNSYQPRYTSYPSYYGSGYNTQPQSTYTSNAKSSYSNTKYTKPTAASSSTVKSPNYGKSSSKIKAPLVKPSSTQKSYQTRNPSKAVKTNGFSSKNSSSKGTSSKSSSSYKSPSRTSSRSSGRSGGK